MKQTKLYIIISTAVLSIAGFIVTKANYKSCPDTIANFTGIPTPVILDPTTLHLTCIKSANSRTLWLATRNGVGATTNLHLAVTANSQNIQIYYK